MDSWNELIAAAKREAAIQHDLPDERAGYFVTAALPAAFRLIDEGVWSVEEAADLATATIMAGLAPARGAHRATGSTAARYASGLAVTWP